MTLLSSTANPTIKQLSKLQSSSRHRRKTELFVVEGLKEVRSALDAGFSLDQYFVPQGSELRIAESEPKEITAAIFSNLVYRETSEILAVFRYKLQTWADIRLDSQATFVVCDGVEKPGNIGAILRTCDAAAVTALVISSNQVADIFNPNVIRSSVGCIFQVPILVYSPEEIKEWFAQHAVHTFALNPDQKLYYDVEYPERIAFIMGAEHAGVSDFWKQNVKEHISIPMLGYNDSLNVSVSAAIAVYDRQRRLAGS